MTQTASLQFRRPERIVDRKKDLLWKEYWNHIAELDGRIVAVACTRPRHNFDTHFTARRAEIWGPIALPEFRGHPDYCGTITKPPICRTLNSLREKGMEEAAILDIEWPPEHTTFCVGLGFRVRNHWKFLRKNQKIYFQLLTTAIGRMDG